MAGELTLKLLDSDSKIQQKILKELKRQINPLLKVAAKDISIIMKARLRALLLQHHTVISLIGGTLRGEFGLVDAKSRIDVIIERWIDSIEVVIKPVSITKTGLTGGFKISMVQSNWSDVLNMAQSTFVTPENSHTLTWLRWLLLEGAKVIIQDYDFSMRTGGRTGQGVMAKVKRKRWSVPVEHQGTDNRNFAIEALDQLNSELPKIFKTELMRVFK